MANLICNTQPWTWADSITGHGEVMIGVVHFGVWFSLFAQGANWDGRVGFLVVIVQIEGWLGGSAQICTLCKLEKPYTKMDHPLHVQVISSNAKQKKKQ